MIYLLVLSILSPLPVTNGLVFTFDDGPSKYTIKLLNILKKHKVKAVFCIPAYNLKSKRLLRIAKRAAKEGHLICNHSYTHPRFDRLSKAAQTYQFKKSQQLFKKHKFKIEYFRPPFGIITSHMRYLVKKYNLKVLMWDIDTRDWSPKTSRQQIYNRVIRKWKRFRKKGKTGVVLFHDVNWKTVSIIKRIIIKINKLSYN